MNKAIQPWDFITSNNLGFLEGNIIKYVSRYKEKNGHEDLLKARHYLDKLIEQIPVTAQAANDPVASFFPALVAVEAVEPERFRFVVLYYYLIDDRRFKPRQYFTTAPTALDAVDEFDINNPAAEAVWVEKVAFFIPDGDRVSRRYWVQR